MLSLVVLFHNPPPPTKDPKGTLTLHVRKFCNVQRPKYVVYLGGKLRVPLLFVVLGRLQTIKHISV